MKKSLLFGLMLLSCWGCDLCGDDLKQEVKSPQGGFVAAVFERNCGATTPYFTHLNLRESREKFKANSDGVIGEGEVYTVKGLAELKVTWLSETAILVETVGGDEVRGKDESWKGITISYK